MIIVMKAGTPEQEIAKLIEELHTTYGVDTNVIRRRPDRTPIPYYLVDAVVEAPYGSHPGEMCYRYCRDEEQIRAWIEASKDPATTAEFLQTYIHNVPDHQAYLDLFGYERLARLRSQAGRAG